MKSAPITAKLTPQRKPFTDVVGLELGAGFAEGVPAVRLRKSEGKTELLAFGFLRLPDVLPETAVAADATHVQWQLPKPYQAPFAALAVTSKSAFLRNATGPGEEGADKQQSDFRSVSHISAPDLPALTAGLPEFQAAWAARLLPEGHRPTVCSLQISSAAAINCFTCAPVFKSVAGTAVSLFVFAEHTALAAFHDSRLVLYREHPVGYNHLRIAVSAQMRIETALADSVLEDTLIDPTPMIEPVLRPLFRQVEISSDYLQRRRNCQSKNFFVCGLPAGAKYWSTVFSHMMNLPLTAFSPFDGIEKPARTHNGPGAATPFLMAAVGAARAVLEDV